MYREISSSWFKHWDFILLDLIVLQVIYVVSIMCRNGFVNPYSRIFIGRKQLFCALLTSVLYSLQKNTAVL